MDDGLGLWLDGARCVLRAVCCVLRAACGVLNACHVLRAGALSVARALETDDVIDPSESRSWIAAALEASAEGRATGRPWGGGGGEDGRKRPCVSPW